LLSIFLFDSWAKVRWSVVISLKASVRSVWHVNVLIWIQFSTKKTRIAYCTPCFQSIRLRYLDITLHIFAMMGSRGSGSAVVGRLFRRMISTTANSTKKNIMLSPITNATSTRRTFVSATNTVLEKHTMKVPSMGDSITEVRRVRGQLFFSFHHYIHHAFFLLLFSALQHNIYCEEYFTSF